MPVTKGWGSTTSGGGSQGGTTGATNNAIVKATAANTLGDSGFVNSSGAILTPATGDTMQLGSGDYPKQTNIGGATSGYPALCSQSGKLLVVTGDGLGSFADLKALGFIASTDSLTIGTNLLTNTNGTFFRQDKYLSFGPSGFASLTSGLDASTAGVIKISDGTTGQGALLAKRVITAKTADYTVTAAETGTVFTNTGASGTVVFTLPASPANGLTYEFHITAAQSVDIKTGTAVLIYANAAATTATTGKLTKNIVGTCIQLVYNGVAWMGVGQSGTWTVS